MDFVVYQYLLCFGYFAHISLVHISMFQFDSETNLLSLDWNWNTPNSRSQLVRDSRRHSWIDHSLRLCLLWCENPCGSLAITNTSLQPILTIEPFQFSVNDLDTWTPLSFSDLQWPIVLTEIVFYSRQPELYDFSLVQGWNSFSIQFLNNHKISSSFFHIFKHELLSASVGMAKRRTWMEHTRSVE